MAHKGRDSRSLSCDLAEALSPLPHMRPADGNERGQRLMRQPTPRLSTASQASGVAAAAAFLTSGESGRCLATPIDAKVNGLEVAEAHCSGQVALKTNLPRSNVEHPLKFGVAVDRSSVVVGTVERVRRSDSVWAAAERAVLANFSRLETAQAARNGEQLPRENPMPAIQITALYREAKSARSPLYFVAEKKYRTPRFPQDPQCSTLTIVTGWLVPTDGGSNNLGVRLGGARERHAPEQVPDLTSPDSRSPP